MGFFNDLKKFNTNTNSYNKKSRGVAGLEKTKPIKSRRVPEAVLDLKNTKPIKTLGCQRRCWT